MVDSDSGSDYGAQCRPRLFIDYSYIRLFDKVKVRQKDRNDSDGSTQKSSVGAGAVHYPSSDDIGTRHLSACIFLLVWPRCWRRSDTQNQWCPVWCLENVVISRRVRLSGSEPHRCKGSCNYTLLVLHACYNSVLPMTCVKCTRNILCENTPNPNYLPTVTKGLTKGMWSYYRCRGRILKLVQGHVTG